MGIIILPTKDQLKLGMKLFAKLALFTLLLVLVNSLAGMAASGVVLAVALGPSIAAASSGSFNLTYVPQFLTFDIDAAPTSLRINVQGDGVIFDMDNSGITALNNIRLIGNIADRYVFQIAEGLIPNKNVTVSVTNASVGTALTLRGMSRQLGTFYIQYLTQVCQAASGINFDNFAYLGFPSAASTDQWNITWGKRNVGGNVVQGVTETNMDRDDVNALLQYSQADVSGLYNIDNFDAMISRVNFIPTAQQNAYYAKYVAAQGVIQTGIQTV